MGCIPITESPKIAPNRFSVGTRMCELLSSLSANCWPFKMPSRAGTTASSCTFALWMPFPINRPRIACWTTGSRSIPRYRDLRRGLSLESQPFGNRTAPIFVVDGLLRITYNDSCLESTTSHFLVRELSAGNADVYQRESGVGATYSRSRGFGL